MTISRLLRGAAVVAILAIVIAAIAWPDLHDTAQADETGFQSPSADPPHAPNGWVTPERAHSSEG